MRAAQLSLSFPRRSLLSFRPRTHRRASRLPRLRFVDRNTVSRCSHSRGGGDVGQHLDRSSSPARGDGGGGSNVGRARAFAWTSWARLFGFFEGGRFVTRFLQTET